MNEAEKEEPIENELEVKQKQNKPLYKEEIFPSPGLNKYPSDESEAIPSKPKKNLKSYLDILLRPSFRHMNRANQTKYESDAPFISEQEADSENKIKYDYPVNIFKRFLFSWTRKVLSAANSKQYLEVSDLGKFSPALYPDKFLSEIKPTWQKVSKRTKNSPLIKTLLLQNMWTLILIFVGNIFVIGSETLNVLLYRQVMLHLDKEPESEPWFNLLTTMIFLLLNLVYDD